MFPSQRINTTLLNTSGQLPTNSTLGTTFPFGAGCIPLSLIGTFSSFVCMYQTYRQYRKRPAAIHLFFFSLSVATLFFSAFSLPLTGYTMMVGSTNYVAVHKDFCRIHAYIYFPLITVCAFSHSSIALQRFITVVLTHFRYLRSAFVTAVLLAASWLIPVVIFVFPLFSIWGSFGYSPPKNRCAFLVLNPVYQTVYKILYSFVPLAIILMSYGAIIMVEINSKRRVTANISKSTSPLSREERKKQRKHQQDLKATRIACVTSIAFVLCYLPYAIYGVAARNLKGLQSQTGMGFDFWVWIGE